MQEAMHFFLLTWMSQFFKNTIPATKPDNSAYKVTPFNIFNFAEKCLDRTYATLCVIIKQPAILMTMS